MPIMSDNDNTLQHRVGKAIHHNPNLNGIVLHVETAAGFVVLRGEVDSYYKSQIVQETVRPVAAAEGAKIDNQLAVARRS